MIGLSFEERAAVVPQHPYRMDIPCFVGFVARRAGAGPGGFTPVPAGIGSFLREQGWLFPENLAGRGQPEALPGSLFDLPVPIESWDVFDRLFAWDERPVTGSTARAATWLGGAVRAFFHQGGRTCYVVRVDDPAPFGQTADADARLARVQKLLPGFPDPVSASPQVQAEWRGAAHVHGLPEAAFLCLPDLPELFALDAERVSVEIDAPVDLVPEAFAACSEEPAPAPADRGARIVDLPRCDDAGYRAWAGAVARAAELVRGHRPDVHVLAALPVPAPGTAAEGDMHGFLAREELLRPLADGGVGSAFVQLAYPWHMGQGSRDLPGGVEPPDGVLAGVLARSALARGSHRSVAAQKLAGGVDTLPRLGRSEQLGLPPAVTGETRTLLERVTLLGPSPGGLRLLSDVTTSADESYRPACVSRILAALIRACQLTGTAAVFESSGPALWARVRESIERVLLQLFEEGALHGRNAAQAYRVRCDRSTMTQNDLDNGRVVVEVTVSPAAPIEHITVALAIGNGGQVSVAALGGGDA